MWTDATADPAGCPGSGEPGEPADRLTDGYPDGRALCPTCLRFVALTDAGTLEDHDTSDPDESDAEAAHRQEWLNTHGW